MGEKDRQPLPILGGCPRRKGCKGVWLITGGHGNLVILECWLSGSWYACHHVDMGGWDVWIVLVFGSLVLDPSDGVLRL